MSGAARDASNDLFLEFLGDYFAECGDHIRIVDKPDLVLLDLTTSGMYGLDVLDKLRQMDAEARVVVASADIQSSMRGMVEERGARGFINKPFASYEYSVQSTRH